MFFYTDVCHNNLYFYSGETARFVAKCVQDLGTGEISPHNKLCPSDPVWHIYMRGHLVCFDFTKMFNCVVVARASSAKTALDLEPNRCRNLAINAA